MKTTCCVVGGGPAGMMLSYLLARRGVEVVLLEAQKDFDRDFRGDTLHPAIMENLEELGLVEELLKLDHAKVYEGQLQLKEKNFQILDFNHLKTKYPYITLMPQDKFLDFMAEKAKAFPNFQLMMETQVNGLLKNEKGVSGVKAKTAQGDIEIEADLVVAADGRFSTVRQAAEIQLRKTAVPMDVLWFKLEKRKDDPTGHNALVGHVMPGYLAAQIDRGDYWQFGGILPKGTMDELREQGIETFHERMSKLLPEAYHERIRQLDDWKELGYFRIDCGRVDKWSKEGLLLIGDAAHIMSPVGGVGINYAIQDAVVAANVLAKPLLAGELQLSDLEQVEKKRIWPTRIIQWFQGFAHRVFIKQALRPDKPLTAPWFARMAWVRRLVARFIAFGWKRVRVEEGVLGG